MNPNHTGDDGGSGERADNADLLSGVLAELKAVREQLGALTSELRARKRNAQKRRRTIARQVADAVHAPTELEIARARRLLR